MTKFSKLKIIFIVILFFVILGLAPGSMAAPSITIDHTSVDLYDDIPDQYMVEAKNMWLNIAGESHSSGYRKGVNFLNELDSRYSAVTVDSGTPTPYREDALRVSGLNRTQYSSWANGAGEDKWYASASMRTLLKNHLTYSNTNNLEIAAMGFGWCWDMTWHNSPGGTVDPIYNVRWAGSSVGGPEGDLRWGLDAEDTALTGNSINLDTYLAATQEYEDYARANNYDTKVLFTTGPVDGYTGESGYQRQLKQQRIRDYVSGHEDLTLFDYADILSWSNSGQQNLQVWSGNSYQMIHPDNLLDYRRPECDPTCPHVEDGDHIGEIGALRLGKALWVLAARLAGWDGSLAAPDTTPPTSPSGLSVS